MPLRLAAGECGCNSSGGRRRRSNGLATNSRWGGTGARKWTCPIRPASLAAFGISDTSIGTFNSRARKAPSRWECPFGMVASEVRFSLVYFLVAASIASFVFCAALSIASFTLPFAWSALPS